LLVAVVALALWQFFATVPVFGKVLLPRSSFPIRSTSAARSSHVLHRRDLEASPDHAVGIGPCVCDRSIGGVLVGFWFARQPRVAAVFDPYVKMINAFAGVVLARSLRCGWGSASGPKSRSA